MEEKKDIKGFENYQIYSDGRVWSKKRNKFRKEVLDKDGYPVQAYTLHIGKPIYPKEELSYRENIEYLRTQNERVWKNIYESAYKIPLSYTYLK